MVERERRGKQHDPHQKIEDGLPECRNDERLSRKSDLADERARVYEALSGICQSGRE